MGSNSLKLPEGLLIDAELNENSRLWIWAVSYISFLVKKYGFKVYNNFQVWGKIFI